MRPRARSSARWSAAAGSCRARARSSSPSPTWSASPGSARKWRRTSSGAWPCAWKRWPAEVAEPPVRLVKTIGDAAMLASPEPEPLLGATLALIEAADAEGEDFPQLRAGAALGQALLRAGDWFGRPVNLASRITSVARPGSLLGRRDPARLGRRQLPLVVRGRAAAEGDPRPGATVQARSPAPSRRPAPPGRPERLRPPGRPTRGPQLVQGDGVLVGVHAVPEALVTVGPQLSVARRGPPAAPARARCRAPIRSSAAAEKQKKPPLIQCSERGFSRNPVTRSPVAISVTPNCSSGRTTVMLAIAPCPA